jgi:hypothetical protein
MMIRESILRSDKPNYRWAVLCDGSPKSISAFHIVARIMDHSKDEVVCISVKDKMMNIDAIRDTMSQHFVKDGVSGDFITLEKEDTVSNTIKAYLMNATSKETYVDFVAVGN